MRRLALPAALVTAMFLAAALLGPSPSSHPTLVVTTSMLGSAAAELLESVDDVEIVRLVPPGCCPGHFDLSPRLVLDLRSALLVIRHDYEEALESKIRQMGLTDVLVLSVSAPGSLLVPSHYLGFLREIHGILGKALPDEKEHLADSMSKMEKRVIALSESVRERSGKWAHVRVIASTHQKEFCEWLGLEVVGVLRRAEEITPRELEALMTLDAEAVVANLQEGPEAALLLGKRLDLPVAVLSNFPGVREYGKTYEDLVRENLQRLEEAWSKR